MVSLHDKEEIKIFLDELNENLNFLDDSIIALEKDPRNQETLEDIFRVAHTIKGSAGFLDLKNLVSLGHAMENVFQEFKTGGVQVGKEVIDTLLDCKDAIGQIGHLLGKGEDTTSINTEPLIKKVNQFLSHDKSNNKTNTPVAPAVPTGLGEFTAHDYIPGAMLVRIWISPNELAPSIRAFLVQKRLSDFGEIVQQKPSEDEMDAENFELPADREIRYWIKTEHPADVIENAARADLIDKVGVLSENVLKELSTHNAQERDEADLKTQKADIDTSDSVRIPVQSLDVMLNLVGELVIANSGFIQIQETLRNFPELQNVFKDVRDRTKDLVRISSEIQGLVMDSRLVPISQVFNRFRRFVRDYSSKSGKKIQMTMTGESTELDKKITDEIIKPLTHLVRNSLDHGLESPEDRLAAGKPETGTLHLEAYQEGNYINIIISDDGRGLNTEKIIQKALQNGIITQNEAMTITSDDVKNLIFHSGFSTKEEVDEMSGRGVGMDVVKSSVEELNGTIIIDSVEHQGTTITIKLPLTLAILNALIVQVGSERYCIPMSAIVETQKVDTKNFLTVDNNEMVRLRDKLIPVIRLIKIFPSLTQETPEESKKIAAKKARTALADELPVIVVDFHNSHIAILVDQFLSRQEVVIKSLSEHYRTIDGISGASILGDGSIILIIDVHGVIQLFKAQRARFFGDTGATPAIKQAIKTISMGKKTVQPDAHATEQKPVAPKEEIKPQIKTVSQPVVAPKKEIDISQISAMTPEDFEELEDLEILTKEVPAKLPEKVSESEDLGITIYPDQAYQEQHPEESIPEETAEETTPPEEEIIAEEETEAPGDAAEYMFTDDDIGIFEDTSNITEEHVVIEEPAPVEEPTAQAEEEAAPAILPAEEVETEEHEFEFTDEIEEPVVGDEEMDFTHEELEVMDEAFGIPEEPILIEDEFSEIEREFLSRDETPGIEIHDTDENLLKEKTQLAHESEHFNLESEISEDRIEPVEVPEEMEESFEFSVMPDDTVITKEEPVHVLGSTEQRLMEEVPEPQAVYDESTRLAASPSSEITIEEIEQEMTEMENYELNEEEKLSSSQSPATEPDTKEEELSEFEKMKMMIDAGEIEEDLDIYQSIALNHFNKDDYDMEKLYNLLEGKDPEMAKTWLKNGNERAIEGIKSLTGHKNIYPGQTRAKKYNRDKLNAYIERFQGDDLPVVGLALPMLPIHGMIYFILTYSNAQNMAAMLYQTAQMTAPDVIDFEPLMEVTNILGSAFTNSLTQITDIPIEPGIPQILENNELLMESMNDHLNKSEEKSILYIENEFLWGEKEVLAELIMMIPKII